ncbi:MAG TPA: hypothetical protein VHG69_08630 [Thermoleophilaceae bacterium]|nr:hypothetical protein [Thermoleophilaceae bacterium]
MTAEPRAGEPPPPELFLSGRVGYTGRRRAVALRAADRALDLWLRARGVPRELDRLAGSVTRRKVLALCVYRPSAELLPAIAGELEASRHSLRLALGCVGDAPPELAGRTVAAGLDGGKFQNLNRLLSVAEPGEHDWLLLVDDDVVLPGRFVDRLLGLCEALDLALAQPAQTLASHGAWPVTRRRARSLARETGFVEIGPVTALRRDAFAELTPFPDLRYGWGLDLHWAAVARERGWRLGVLDALPVRHEQASVAGEYGHQAAVDEAAGFLASRPFVPAKDAARTLGVHRRLPCA